MPDQDRPAAPRPGAPADDRRDAPEERPGPAGPAPRPEEGPRRTFDDWASI